MNQIFTIKYSEDEERIPIEEEIVVEAHASVGEVRILELPAIVVAAEGFPMRGNIRCGEMEGNYQRGLVIIEIES